MEDVEELARKVWYAHPMCPEPVRQSNIKGREGGSGIFGDGWIARHKQARIAAPRSTLHAITHT